MILEICYGGGFGFARVAFALDHQRIPGYYLGIFPLQSVSFLNRRLFLEWTHSEAYWVNLNQSLLRVFSNESWMDRWIQVPPYINLLQNPAGEIYHSVDRIWVRKSRASCGVIKTIISCKAICNYCLTRHSVAWEKQPLLSPISSAYGYLDSIFNIEFASSLSYIYKYLGSFCSISRGFWSSLI